MPASLHIPQSTGNPLRLQRRVGTHRGRASRMLAVAGQERRDAFIGALMKTSLTCFCLWAGFWIQFLVGFLSNQPALHTLLDSNWWAPQVEFFIRCPRGLPFSMAQNFAMLSAVGALLAVIDSWLWTRGIHGRWRMRLAVCLFAGWTVVWSTAALAAEDAAWQHLEDERAKLVEQLHHTHDEAWQRSLKRRIDWSDQLLESKPSETP